MGFLARRSESAAEPSVGIAYNGISVTVDGAGVDDLYNDDVTSGDVAVSGSMGSLSFGLTTALTKGDDNSSFSFGYTMGDIAVRAVNVDLDSPTAGDIFTVSLDSTLSATYDISTGENKTWNFADLMEDESDTYTFTPFTGTDVAGATMTLVAASDPTTVTFIGTTNTSSDVVGISVMGLTVPLSDAMNVSGAQPLGLVLQTEIIIQALLSL